MKKYMVIGYADGQTFTMFAETYSEARDKKFDIECGLGGYAELYCRENLIDGYELLEA